MNQKTKTIKAFSYERVSHDLQTDGMSLHYQTDNAKSYALANGIEIVKNYTVTESGRTSEKRKVFKQMLDDALEYGIQHLVFKSIDRLTRNYDDMIKLEKLIYEHDFKVHVYGQGKVLDKDMDHSGKFMLAIEVAVARQLSDKISNDVKNSNRYRVSQGICPGRSPYGYIYQKTEPRGHIIDKSKISNVRLIFSRFLSGDYTLQSFIDFLDTKGIKNSRNDTWTRNTIRSVLINPFYAGYFDYKGQRCKGKHEAIITLNDHEKILDILNKRYAPRTGATRQYLYNGLIKCSNCGLSFYGDSPSKYDYYVHKCRYEKKQVSISAEDVNMFFHAMYAGLDKIYTTALDKLIAATWDAFTEKRETHDDTIRLSTKSIDARLGHCNRKKRQLFDLLGGNDFNPDDIKEQLELNQKEIETLTIQKLNLEKQKDEELIQYADIYRAIKMIPEIFMNGTYEQKRSILQATVSKAFINNSPQNDDPTFTLEFKDDLQILLDDRIYSIARDFEKVHKCNHKATILEHEEVLFKVLFCLNRMASRNDLQNIIKQYHLDS